MAWRSSGVTHKALIDNLTRHGLILSQDVEDAFRNVDRKLFVPVGFDEYAYLDQPLKEGEIHLSAPHMYCTIVESLELEKDTSLSFLNIGSGTGYLSCIIASILGIKSLNYGVEISEAAFKHSHERVSKWKSSTQPIRTHMIEIVHGNGLQIDPTKGEGRIGFDRIYVGASIEKSDLDKFTQLLRPGGIIVVPVEDELLKIIRVLPMTNSDSMTEDSSRTLASSSQFIHQTITGVRFASLAKHPSMDTCIQAKIWSPQNHKMYPQSFHEASKEIMLCSRAKYIQVQNRRPVNNAAKLPVDIWTHVFTFTDRTWFESDQNNVQLLKKRLDMERSLVAKTEHARVEAETRCFIAERERDLYKRMVQRMQERLSLLMNDPVVQGSPSQQSQMALLHTILHGSTIHALDSALDMEEAVEDNFMQDGDNDDYDDEDIDDDDDDDDVEMQEDVSVVEPDELDEDLYHESVAAVGVDTNHVSHDMYRQPRSISITDDDI